MAPLAGLLGGVLSSAPAAAMTLPEDTAEVMYHLFDGAASPRRARAVLVRKSLFDKVSLTGTYYVDMVSNASIDVVTTASPFKETRSEYNLGADYVYRDSLLSASYSNSNEPDYKAQAAEHRCFAGSVRQHDHDQARLHARQRRRRQDRRRLLRLRQALALSPRRDPDPDADMAGDAEPRGGCPTTAISAARIASALVFGAFVPENVPRTRSSRPIKLGVIGEVMPRTSVHANYRYFYDTWDIKAHTFEVGGSRYVGESFLIDGYVRYYKQSARAVLQQQRDVGDHLHHAQPPTGHVLRRSHRACA